MEFWTQIKKACKTMMVGIYNLSLWFSNKIMVVDVNSNLFGRWGVYGEFLSNYFPYDPHRLLIINIYSFLYTRVGPMFAHLFIQKNLLGSDHDLASVNNIQKCTFLRSSYSTVCFPLVASFFFPFFELEVWMTSPSKLLFPMACAMAGVGW